MKFNLSYSVAEDHPVIPLAFFLVGSPSEPLTRSFEELLARVRKSRIWVIHEPQLIDYIDEKATEAGEESLKRTYGVALSLYSAYPPWRERLPKHVDRGHFEEVCVVVDELAKFSKSFGTTFEVEMNNESIGEIQGGEIDKSLQHGLIDEWKKAVASY